MKILEQMILNDVICWVSATRFGGYLKVNINQTECIMDMADLREILERIPLECRRVKRGRYLRVALPANLKIVREV